MSKQIKIAIVDDHDLVCESFALALKTNNAFKVVATANNGKQLIELLSSTKPDIILLDLEMPIFNGWDTLEYLHKNLIPCRTIVVSMHFRTQWINDLASKGARGFLPKNIDLLTLTNAILEVNTVGYYFSSKVNKKLVSELVATNRIFPTFSSANLNPSEIQVLRLICQDKITKEIADSINSSVRTAERIRATLYEKTNTRTPAGLLLFALKQGIVSFN